MSDAFQKLFALVPPPSRPVENGTEEKFNVVEEHLGLKFPTDYKQVIRTYGQGIWRGGLVLFNPFTSDVCYNLIAAATGQLEEAEHHLLFPENAPFPLYPEPAGLLPWARTEQNDICYWLREGEPDEWPTILTSEDHDKYEKYDLGCAAFLCQWLEQERDTPFSVPFCPVQ